MWYVMAFAVLNAGCLPLRGQHRNRSCDRTCFPFHRRPLQEAPAPETCPERAACGSGSSWTGWIVAQAGPGVGVRYPGKQNNIVNKNK